MLNDLNVKAVEDRTMAFFNGVKSGVGRLLKSPDMLIERYVLVLGLIFGLTFVFLIPPMQGADEPNHFMRIYQISQGDLVSDRVLDSYGGINPEIVHYKTRPNYGGRLPAGIVDFAQGTYDLHGVHKLKMTSQEFNKLSHIRTGTDLKAGAFPNTAAYSPFAYIPQVAGVEAGRIFGASPLILSYLARLAGLFVGLAMIVLAIRLLPFGKLPAAVIALLPMTISQLAVISADTLAIATGFLAVALTLHYSFKAKSIGRWDILLLLAIYAWLGLNKQSLVPLALLNFGLLLNPAITRVRALAVSVSTIIFSVAIGWLWNGLVKDIVIFGYQQSYPHANYNDQMNFITHHPFSYLHVLYESFFTNGFTIVTISFIGDIGWLDTPLPPLFMVLSYALIGVAFFIAAQHNRIKLPRWFRNLAALSSLGVIIATVTLLYLLTMHPGAKFIKGQQGRYFIPAIIPLVAAFGKGRRLIPDKDYLALSRKCLLLSGVILTIMAFIIFRRYYHAGLVAKSIVAIKSTLA